MHRNMYIDFARNILTGWVGPGVKAAAVSPDGGGGGDAVLPHA
jgi:hypothetical protein